MRDEVKLRSDELRFTVMADTVDGIRKAADEYLHKIGAKGYDVSYDVTGEIRSTFDGAGRLCSVVTGPLTANVTVRLDIGS